MTKLLDISGLSVRYRRDGETVEALQDVSFDLTPGEKLAIIGESGSGKSSLALALGGLLPATAGMSGAIAWPGFKTHPQNGRDIGFVFQDPGGSLDPLMRVGAQIAESYLAHVPASRQAGRQMALDLLQRVGLPAAAVDAFPFQLSGGQRQRVAIACAIAAKPALMIADEATSALDTVTQAGIVSLIAGLVADEGMSLIFITHDIALASQLGDRIAVFRHGRLVELGTARDVIANPRADYVRRLVSAHISLTAAPILEQRP